MVLAPELTEEERIRHEALIKEGFSSLYDAKDVSIELIGKGAEKGVYKVSFRDTQILAAAASKDIGRSLLEEYNILNILKKGAPQLFPDARGHYVSPDSDLGELLLMECLPHKDIDVFKRENVLSLGFYKLLAHEIGKAVAIVNSKTGRYSSEPHNGNILIKEDEGKIDLRFCDAIQFRLGDLDEAVESIMGLRDERGECYRFIPHFRKGLAEGLTSSLGISTEEAYERVDFLRQYNDIF